VESGILQRPRTVIHPAPSLSEHMCYTSKSEARHSGEHSPSHATFLDVDSTNPAPGGENDGPGLTELQATVIVLQFTSVESWQRASESSRDSLECPPWVCLISSFRETNLFVKVDLSRCS
jgi:hypothetical protein